MYKFPYCDSSGFPPSVGSFVAMLLFQVLLYTSVAFPMTVLAIAHGGELQSLKRCRRTRRLPCLAGAFPVNRCIL